MGYMGLEHPMESDAAASCMSGMLRCIAKYLKKELKEKGNSYNTNGIINVALTLEDIFSCNGKINENMTSVMDDNFLDFIQDVIQKLENYIEEEKQANWDDKANRSYHLNAYKRMLKILKKFHNKCSI